MRSQQNYIGEPYRGAGLTKLDVGARLPLSSFPRVLGGNLRVIANA